MDFAKIDACYKKVSYQKQSQNLSLEEWQYALRKKFAETHIFKIKKIGEGIVYSDYTVYNPDTNNTYKVAIRSADNSVNFCECNDFKTNGLGTCKHIEATFFYIINDMKMGNMLSIDFRPNYTSIYLDYRIDRKIRIRIGTENEKEFTSLAKLYFTDDLILRETSIDQFDDLLLDAYKTHTSFRCYPDVLEHIIALREKRGRKKLLEIAYVDNNGKPKFEGLINATLFPYQEDGIMFAAKSGRCIIADDMGLGKTIQAIATAVLLKKEKFIENVLIVCPTSLKYQWQSEIAKFSGFDALVIEGVATKREMQYKKEGFSQFFKIVSYHAAVNDIDYINNEGYDLVILDEAQRIKNFNTKISRTVKKIISSLTIVLTGTPLENKLEELYSIVQFVDPFALGPFYKFIHNHLLKDENGKVIGYKDLNEIGRQLSGIMLRRKKHDVLKQLPERTDKVLEVPMTPKQKQIHDEYASNVAQIINKWKRQGFLKEKDRQSLMIYLNMMRMSCDSTFVLDQETRHDTKIDELLNIIDEVVGQGDEKIVVFSQWERMTRIVAQELNNKGIKFENLNGSVPSPKRAKLFENFNSDPDCRVFLSTDAGGVGLNLQAASILVNLDIPWNPAVLEQRIGRIYRLGQEKKVSIINMVSSETIEHRMLGVISFKKGLSEGILDQGDNTIFMGESKFKKFMETVEDISVKPGKETSDDAEETFETIENLEQSEKEAEPNKNEKATQGVLFGDDDVAAPNQIGKKKTQKKENEPSDMVKMGMKLLSEFGKILNDTNKTKKLVSSMVSKDEKDGKTYLKLPVENEAVVENTLKALMGILDHFQKQ